jgi:hypothetical protein
MDCILQSQGRIFKNSLYEYVPSLCGAEDAGFENITTNFGFVYFYLQKKVQS